jgi:oxysterol-binding protein-related protein 8
MDLSKIMIPCEFLEPRSLLERMTDFMTHSFLCINATDKENELDRMKEVLRWYISCWHIKPRGVKKPYNPILGEIFRCVYKLPDNSVLTFFAEQISHHPPISALYGENKEKGFYIKIKN